MSDVNVLLAVTAVVLAALLIWAGYVLLTAENAVDESPEGRAAAKKAAGAARKNAFDEPTTITRRVAILDETPPPATLDVAVPSERAVAIAGKSSPVVVLPVMRARLDSHSEIGDGSNEPAGTDPASAADTRSELSVMPGTSYDSVLPPAGPPFSLVSAIGRSEPATGPTEVSAIVDRHRLFILADGGGQRVQNELVSAVVTDALAAAFEVGADASYPAHATLPRRADRLRRSVVAALTVLEARGAGSGLEMARVGVLAAHFSPDNRRVYVCTVGADRAYRLRAQEVVHLNKASLAGPSADGPAVETVVADTAADDVYVFGTDKAFLALGDELRAVLTSDASIDRVAARFVEAATRQVKTAGVTAIAVRVNPPRASVAPPAV